MKINRRDFIKTGGMVMLGSLAVPSFLGSCTGNKVDQATGISFAQNHFGVSESDMKKVLAAALEKGGDYADLFFEHCMTLAGGRSANNSFFMKSM